MDISASTNNFCIYIMFYILTSDDVTLLVLGGGWVFKKLIKNKMCLTKTMPLVGI